MPKNFKCPCGNMEAKFPGRGKVQLKGGYLYGNTKAWFVCYECGRAVRVGYDHEYLDKDGEVFHVSADNPGKKGAKSRVKKPARKPTRKSNQVHTEGEVWSFPS